MSKQQIVHVTKYGHERCITQPFVRVGCLIEKDKKFLLINQNGKWNQPCGWLELGENIVNGAKRETEEETGLEVAVDSLLGVYTLIKQKGEKTLHAVKFIFNAHPTGRTVTSPEKLPYEWFTLEQIRSMDGQFWDADVVKEMEDCMSGIKYPARVVDVFTDLRQK